jgi:hypothetical protein
MCGFSGVLYTAGNDTPEVVKQDLENSLDYLAHRSVFFNLLSVYDDRS